MKSLCDDAMKVRPTMHRDPTVLEIQDHGGHLLRKSAVMEWSPRQRRRVLEETRVRVAGRPSPLEPRKCHQEPWMLDMEL